MKEKTIFVVLAGLGLYHIGWWTYLVWKAYFNKLGYVCTRFDKYREHIPEMALSMGSFIITILGTTYLLTKVDMKKKVKKEKENTIWLSEIQKRVKKKYYS